MQSNELVSLFYWRYAFIIMCHKQRSMQELWQIFVREIDSTLVLINFKMHHHSLVM